MKRIDEVILQILEGKASPDEFQELQTWLADSPENDRTYQAILTYWHEHSSPNQQGQERMWERVNAQLVSQTPSSPSSSSSVVSLRRWGLGIAAAIALLLGFGLWAWNPSDTPAIAMEEHQNPPGIRTEWILPDGSKVWLNADSKITFPTQFEQERTVHLRGEAYFEVVSDPERPFWVHSGEVHTKATGTAFNVTAFPEAQEIQVALIEGVVSVSPADPAPQSQVIQLTPGEQAIYGKAERALSKGKIAQASPVAWTQGWLTFEGEQVSEVAERLSRWYGVPFHIQQPNRMQTRLRHHIQTETKPLEVVLAEISRIADYQFVQTADTVWIRPK
ncbi:MAG: FecR domain-containing protein [Bacteroidota bacterium]